MECVIGFIGGGNMSTAIAKGILKNGQYSALNIWVSGPHIENLKHWKEFGANTTTKNGEVFSKCNLIFIGVKPYMLKSAVKDCINTLDDTIKINKSVLFVSMLAGITIDQLHGEFLALTEQARIIRIMPNTPITVGAGACLYSPGPGVTNEDCAMLEKLLSASAICCRVQEAMMNPLGALVGCGPAFMYIVIEALADGAVKQGVPRAMAQRLAAQMVLGSGKMVLETGKHPGLLKDEVCSPGGSTICGVAALEDGKVRAAMINALEASSIRNKELGEK